VEIIEKYIGNGWNIISTDAFIGPGSSCIGILEMPSGVSHKFKFDVSLFSTSAELAGIKIACDISHKSKYNKEERYSRVPRL